MSFYNFKKAIMPVNLPIERFDENKRRTPALIIPISSIKTPIEKKRETVTRDAVKKELPKFYTEPIFKARKYDFL